MRRTDPIVNNQHLPGHVSHPLFPSESIGQVRRLAGENPVTCQPFDSLQPSDRVNRRRRHVKSVTSRTGASLARLRRYSIEKTRTAWRTGGRSGQMMDITRNQYFFAGLLCLLLGAQFRISIRSSSVPSLRSFLRPKDRPPAGFGDRDHPDADAIRQADSQEDRSAARLDRRGLLISLGSRAGAAQLGDEKPGT